MTSLRDDSGDGVNSVSANLANPVICVVGPTASGKTDLAQEIAHAIDGEVLSADSMQVYRGMDIGTGKLPPHQRKVAHHGFDLVDPGQPFSAALFQAYARDTFACLDRALKRCVMAGGTGFYVRAAIDDYRFPAGEQVENPIRDRWNRFTREQGPQALWERLCAVDPQSAEVIPANDVKRLVRAFELLDDGTSYAEQKRKLASIPQVVPAVLIGLAVDPELLRQRICRRVDKMVSQGLVDEVRGLLDRGFRRGITAPQAIGYKEIVAALDGRCTMDEAISSIKVSTCRYAKRQRTWFRKDSRIHWLCADSGDTEALLASSLELLDRIDAR